MNLLKFILLTFATSLFSFANQPLSEISGKVISVIDGNIIEILTDDGDKLLIKLSEVDSPELGQDFGAEALAYTSKFCLNKIVKIAVVGKDRKGMRLGIVRLKSGKQLNTELLKSGLAWHSHHCIDRCEMKLLEIKAKKKKLGLWVNANPTPPWIYRRQQSMRSSKSLN